MHGQHVVMMSDCRAVFRRRASISHKAHSLICPSAFCSRPIAEYHYVHMWWHIVLHETVTTMTCSYLLFDAPPVKLRPLLKKPLVLAGFFSLEAFTAGAGI